MGFLENLDLSIRHVTQFIPPSKKWSMDDI